MFNRSGLNLAVSLCKPMLATIRHTPPQPPEAPPLVIAHGLYGSARNWGVIARRLADRREVVAVDMRNHGDSPRFPLQGYPEMAADLAEVIESLGAPVDLLGHSMGGKAAMQLALTRPELIRRLVVADIAPVAYGHDQTRNARAMAALDLSGIRSRGEADSALAAGIEDPALRAFFLQSLDLRSHPPRWKLNLPVLEAEMPKIVGWPDTQGQFPNPALFLTGALSPYVRPEHRDTIRALFPKARFAKIPEAGHWLHAEQPRAFEETVRVFLEA
jgi:esterase